MTDLPRVALVVHRGEAVVAFIAAIEHVAGVALHCQLVGDGPLLDELRQQVNEAVTQDFLGSSWRHKTEVLENEPANRDEDPELRLLKGIDRDRYLAKLRERLTARERELLDAVMKGMGPRDFANTQGLAL